MTNDELNRWYYEHLGWCVHEPSKDKRKGKYVDLDICNKCEVVFYNANEPFPDYLNDAAVILGIMQELIDDGHSIEPHYKNCNIIPGEIFITWLASGPTNRAIMLALKAKIEQKEKAVA